MKLRRLTHDELSMILSEAAAMWPTGDIDLGITGWGTAADVYAAIWAIDAVRVALFTSDGFLFTDPCLVLALLEHRGLA